MTNRPLKKVVFLVTGNVHKFNEARPVLREFGLSTAMLNVEAIEIQADNIEDVAKTSAVDAAKKCELPIIVEDAGLSINALNGFPGPYSSYIFRTIGTKGILKLMDDLQKRNAKFESVVAFYDIKLELLKCFHGKVEGKITEQPRGLEGFGFDPIFAPLSDAGATFAEMPMAEKNRYSHRAKALRAFAEWYVSGF